MKLFDENTAEFTSAPFTLTHDACDSSDIPLVPIENCLHFVTIAHNLTQAFQFGFSVYFSSEWDLRAREWLPITQPKEIVYRWIRNIFKKFTEHIVVQFKYIAIS